VLQLATEGHFGKERVNAPPGITIYPIPALETFLETPWTALAEVVTRHDANALLKTTSGLSNLGECNFDDPPPVVGPSFSFL
jgi:hypothetical protein